MKEFASAAQRAEKAQRDKDEVAGLEPVEFNVAEKVVRFNYPGSGQVVYFAMILGTEKRDIQWVGRLINWCLSLVDDEGHAHLSGLLLDPESGFDGEDMVDIVTALVQEWMDEVPTARPADYLPSRRAAGVSSTAASRRAGSTPSRSRRAGSPT